MAHTAAQHSIRRHAAEAAVGSAAASVRTPPPRLSGRNSYSLFVTSMKVVLPALAAGLVLLVVAWPQIMPDISRSGIDFQKIARDQAKTLNMLNARYSGVDENTQPFNVAADLATQSPDAENHVELQHPQAALRTTKDNQISKKSRRRR